MNVLGFGEEVVAPIEFLNIAESLPPKMVAESRAVV
jgi:hypothetical protein